VFLEDGRVGDGRELGVDDDSAVEDDLDVGAVGGDFVSVPDAVAFDKTAAAKGSDL